MACEPGRETGTIARRRLYPALLFIIAVTAALWGLAQIPRFYMPPATQRLVHVLGLFSWTSAWFYLCLQLRQRFALADFWVVAVPLLAAFFSEVVQYVIKGHVVNLEGCFTSILGAFTAIVVWRKRILWSLYPAHDDEMSETGKSACG
jgi:hypothetical protein